MSEPIHRSDALPIRLLDRLPAAFSVMAGGFLGAGLRAGAVMLVPVQGTDFPWTTLMVNLIGALLLGFFLSRRASSISSPGALRFWAIGALGSFTTFSTFSVEVYALFAEGALLIAIGYVVASLLGGTLAAIFGRRLGEVTR